MSAYTIAVEYSVTDKNGTSHFFRMRQGEKTISQVMVFVPLKVSLPEQAPMLVYYHGHDKKDGKPLLNHKDIDDYVRSRPERDLRPRLMSKRVVLVEPWGQWSSTFPGLGGTQGLTALVRKAMCVAISQGPPARPCSEDAPPWPPSLILAGFSGGGATLKSAGIGLTGPCLALLTEVWCFDCMYSGEGGAWLKWARANAKTLRVRVTSASAAHGEGSGAPRREAAGMQAAIGKQSDWGADSIDVGAPVDTSHEALPGMFIPRWLSPTDGLNGV